MNASVCLSFNYDVLALPRLESDTLSELLRQKHRAAMQRAHDLLCPEISSRSTVLELLDSVRPYPWLNVA
jgi:hypothetical protein